MPHDWDMIEGYLDKTHPGNIGEALRNISVLVEWKDRSRTWEALDDAQYDDLGYRIFPSVAKLVKQNEERFRNIRK